MANKGKINVVTLGCSKNLVDSERLMRQAEAAGYGIVFDSDDPSARVVVINTCGFIGDAKQESIDTILGFAQAKEAGMIDRIFVMGCLSERYKKELETEIPEVDSYFGADNIGDVLNALGADYQPCLSHERYITTPPHYAYLKISEGCNWGCSYCAIPLIRGKHRSVPMEELEQEARALAGKGVKELIVIAQDTTYYGMDLYGGRRLGELLTRLCRIEGIEWVRLHYAYPAQFPMDVLEVMAREEKMCKYIDIPFQHIDSAILASMRRGVDREKTMELIRAMRDKMPSMAIRTTLIVGYPGETQEQFDELMRFVEEVKFDRLGVFPYSEEEGTHAAETLADDVPEEEKERRVEAVMSLQSRLSKEQNHLRLGMVEKVIIDRTEGNYYVGRTQYDSPEVDQEVLIEQGIKLRIGKFYTVKIVDATDFDLFGQVV